MLTPAEHFAWKAVLGHSMAGLMQGRSAGSSLSGKNLSIYDKWHLERAERWDPHTGYPHRDVRSWQSAVEMFMGSTEEQRGGREPARNGGGDFGSSWNLAAVKARGGMRADLEEESLQRHRKGSGTTRMKWTHPNPVISIVSLWHHAWSVSPRGSCWVASCQSY